MIKEIHMRSCATYDADGIFLKDCPKVNFIYGPNGSGKSTISNFLQSPHDPFYAASEIVWDSESHADIMVYNRRFKDQHFRSNADIEGVFTLGEATIEDIKKLDELKAEREKREEEQGKTARKYREYEDKIAKLKSDFRETSWNVILKDSNPHFQEAFSGLRNNKDKFCDHVLKRFAENHDSEYTEQDLVARCLSLYGSKPETCPLFIVPDSAIVRATAAIESDTMFQKAVVGNQDLPISGLIHSLQNSDWVNHGRHFVSESPICPFCQKNTIDDTFRKQLEDFFSGEYEQNLARIRQLHHDYQRSTAHLIAVYKELLSNNYACRIGKLNTEVFHAQMELLENVYSGNLAAITAKIAEPGRKVELKQSDAVASDLLKMIQEANREIDNHNQMVKHLSAEKKKLTDDIWAFLMDQNEVIIQTYLQGANNSQKAKNAIGEKLERGKQMLRQINENITEAERSVTSVKPTVDEINRSLLAYGFTNFQIQPSPHNPNMYQIQRPDGSLVSNTLSEGEETFITFLYFMQLAKGSSSSSAVSNKRIIVIDDPICSLDSTILYVVSAMVKSLIKTVKNGASNVEQIFILTHNVFFHKEASFVNGRTNPEPTVNFWVLRKNDSMTTITPHGIKNPISTSYELLWQELKADQPSSIITTQNTMRRIIENYFGMLGGAKEDYIVEKFETVEDQMICRSLFHWINDGSHSIPDDFYFDVQSTSVAKYKEIFRRIFEVTNHKAHYDMMMGIEAAQ